MDWIFTGAVLIIVFGYFIYTLIYDVEKNDPEESDFQKTKKESNKDY